MRDSGQEDTPFPNPPVQAVRISPHSPARQSVVVAGVNNLFFHVDVM